MHEHYQSVMGTTGKSEKVYTSLGNPINHSYVMPNGRLDLKKRIVYENHHAVHMEKTVARHSKALLEQHAELYPKEAPTIPRLFYIYETTTELAIQQFG